MSSATHALQFSKDALEPGAAIEPALPARHRFVFVARGLAVVDDVLRERETAAYGSGDMAVRAGPDGAELWRWELVPVDAEPVVTRGTGVRSRHIVTQDIDTIGLGARDRWLFRCDGIAMARDAAAPLHVHAGPGLRCMIEGSMIVDDKGVTEEHRDGGWWYETNVQPIVARATGPDGARFVRVMIAAPEFKGFRTTQIIDPDAQQKGAATGRGRWTLYVEKVITL